MKEKSKQKREVQKKYVEKIRKDFLDGIPLSRIQIQYSYTFKQIKAICLNKEHYDENYIARSLTKEDEKKQRLDVLNSFLPKTKIHITKREKKIKQIQTEEELIRFCSNILNIQPLIHYNTAVKIKECSETYEQYSTEIQRVIHVLKTNKEYKYILNIDMNLSYCSNMEQMNKVLDVLDYQAIETAKFILEKIKDKT